MRTKLIFSFLSLFLMLQTPLLVRAVPYTVTTIGELSPPNPIAQWEISSAVLPGSLADSMCISPRTPGDPQIFVSWYGGVFPTNQQLFQRTMSCALSELGNCDADIGAILPSDDTCPDAYIAGSNDNVMVRLRDGRIISTFQTIKDYCPGDPVNNTSMPLAEIIGDGIGDDDGTCAEKLGDGIGDERVVECQPGEVCAEDCIEIIGDGIGDDDGVCEPIENARDEICEPIYETTAYYTRISDDCGQSWDESILDASQITDLAGNPLSPPVCCLDRVEMYADPWSDHVLMTARGGDWGFGNPPELPYADPNNEANLYWHASTAGGATSLNWELMFRKQDAGGFSVMTSMPHTGGVSRIFWFQCDGARPILYVADNPWILGKNNPQVFDVASYLLLTEGLGDYECSLVAEAGPPQNRREIRNIIGNTGIARISTDESSDTVRVAYPQQITVQGAPYATLRVVDIEIPALYPVPLVVPRTNRIIDPASNPGTLPRGSVFYPSIIQVDQVTTDDPVAATHLLHWTEIRDDLTVVEKFATWDPINLWNHDNVLDPIPWTCIGNCAPGDYQYGAFIDTLDNCTHQFFVPWGVSMPPTKTHGAIVTTTTDRIPPTLENVPSDQTVQCDSVPEPAIVTATDNCDPDPLLEYSETRTDGDCPSNFTLTREWTATDTSGYTSTSVQTINVVDTTAPVIENATANPNELWPPNHKMVQVAVAATATDNCDPAPDCAISNVSSNEPVNGLGDGNTDPDWVVTGNLTVDLRAERSGKGDGRIYTIEVTCTDECGNSSTETVEVNVPHDKGKK